MKSEMIVAGVMSGTSADGINVALVRFEGQTQATRSGSRSTPRDGDSSGSKSRFHSYPFELIGHAEFPYRAKVRRAILTSMNATQATVADLARLNFLLGELYSDAVLSTQRRFGIKANLVGCHGQTLYHQGEPAEFLGRKVSATWQTGEGAIIAARTHVPVVSDFRPADIAAGGKGAPLVPFLDYMLFRDTRLNRMVQNIGGIANLTFIPANASPARVLAFDTGPGNMVIDAVTEYLFGLPFDADGKIAARGRVVEPLIDGILRHPFFRKKPPKSAGREEFGREFVRDFLCNFTRRQREDAVATATALTAKSIARAIEQFVIGRSERGRQRLINEMILSGGGAENSTLVSMLRSELTPLGIRIRSTDEFGIPSAAKEAVAFALLALGTWYRRPSNLPSATGAKREAVLGKISYP